MVSFGNFFWRCAYVMLVHKSTHPLKYRRSTEKSNHINTRVLYKRLGFKVYVPRTQWLEMEGWIDGCHPKWTKGGSDQTWCALVGPTSTLEPNRLLCLSWPKDNLHGPNPTPPHTYTLRTIPPSLAPSDIPSSTCWCFHLSLPFVV